MPSQPRWIAPETTRPTASPPGSGDATSARGATRRSFLGASVAVPCGAAAARPTGGLFIAGDQRLRVGLVGCGGRGTGAAAQAMAADPTVRVVALGDVFADQVASAADVLATTPAGRNGRFACPPERRFVGPEAYRRVIDSDVDVVLLAAPPHVRPLHLEAAVTAGKHVYCEKPVAIDVAGVIRAAAAAARGRAAGLALVSGFCFRRDERMVEMVRRIHDGAIGRPLAVRAHAAIGLPWRRPAESGLERGDWPLRNWISFVRFSGGHFVEHHVEAIDRAAWILGDAAPLVAEPLDARADVRRHVDAAAGILGDCPATTAVRYRFPDGVTIEASIDRREQPRDSVDEMVSGADGWCDLTLGRMAGRCRWAAAAPARAGRHAAAIADLVHGILSGRVCHDGETMCRSTMMAVIGRAAAETGRPVWWDQPTQGASTPA